MTENSPYQCETMNEERIRRTNEARYFSPSGSIYFRHTPAVVVGPSGINAEQSGRRETI